jgi:hypothetical protein
MLMPDILALHQFLARLAVHAHPQDVFSREIGREQSATAQHQSDGTSSISPRNPHIDPIAA